MLLLLLLLEREVVVVWCGCVRGVGVKAKEDLLVAMTTRTRMRHTQRVWVVLVEGIVIGCNIEYCNGWTLLSLRRKRGRYSTVR